MAGDEAAAVGAWRHVRRPWLRALNIAVTLVLAVFWWNLYRPQLIGGPAAYAMVAGTSMESTLVDGDFVITRGHDSYHVGEVIAYRVPDGFERAGLRVIHRIIGGSAETGYITRGDNRAAADPWHPTSRDVIGSVALRIPYAGSVVGVLREPPVFAWFVGSIVLTSLWALDRRRRSEAIPA
ncbi:MAG: signal peptidase I [Acidimicrobiia bacterium]